MTIKLKQRKSSNFAILLPFAPCLVRNMLGAYGAGLFLNFNEILK